MTAVALDPTDAAATVWMCNDMCRHDGVESPRRAIWQHNSDALRPPLEAFEPMSKDAMVVTYRHSTSCMVPYLIFILPINKNKSAKKFLTPILLPSGQGAKNKQTKTR